MRARFVLIVAGLAAAALLVAILELHRHHSRPPPMRLIALAPGQVTRIAAQASGWPPLALIRRREGWTMRAPVRAPADASRVAALVSALEEPVAREYPAGTVQFGNTGLDHPALTVAVNGTTLEFGAVNPATLLRYIRHDDEVALAMDYVTPMLQNGPWQFVDPHLLPPGAGIEKIRLPTQTLTRTGDTWRLLPASPAGTSASQLANAWLHARASAVLPLATTPAVTGGEIRIRLIGRTAPIVFVPVPSKSGIALARPDIGVIYRLDSATAHVLLAGPRPGTSDARAAGS